MNWKLYSQKSLPWGFPPSNCWKKNSECEAFEVFQGTLELHLISYLMRDLTSRGMLPVSLFQDRSRSSRRQQLPRAAGIVPDNWFSESSNLLNCLRSPKEWGIGPESIFWWIDMLPSFLSWEISVGMLPCNLLFRRRNLSNLWNMPNSGGILPLKRLSASARYVKLVRLPISWGMLPCILVLDKK